MTCPAVRKRKKKKLYQKNSICSTLPSLTASCFLLFSPAGQVLSGWTLNRGEANKDSQNEKSSCFSTFFFCAGDMNSFCPYCTGPFISHDSPGCRQFLWTLDYPSYSACDNNVLVRSAYQAPGSLPPSSVQLILIMLCIKMCGYFFFLWGICLIPKLTLDKSLVIVMCILLSFRHTKMPLSVTNQL